MSAQTAVALFTQGAAATAIAAARYVAKASATQKQFTQGANLMAPWPAKAHEPDTGFVRVTVNPWP